MLHWDVKQEGEKWDPNCTLRSQTSRKTMWYMTTLHPGHHLQDTEDGTATVVPRKRPWMAASPVRIVGGVVRESRHAQRSRSVPDGLHGHRTGCSAGSAIPPHHRRTATEIGIMPKYPNTPWKTCRVVRIILTQARTCKAV